MSFIAQYKDGSTFTDHDGYWSDSPDKGITALHIKLPFSIKKKEIDGSITELEPSTIMLNGFEQYYFANRATALILIGGMGGMPQSKHIGWCMAGIDRTHDFVLYIEVDKRGNIKHQRFTIERFIKSFNIKDIDLRKGD